MKVFPVVTIGVAHQLPHGTPVVLNGGSVGLVWVFNDGIVPIERHFVVDLRDFRSRATHEVAMQNTYLPTIAGELEIYPDMSSLTHNIAGLQAGDLVVTTNTEEVRLVLKHPTDDQVAAFSFSGPSQRAHIHPGYAVLIKQWKLVLRGAGEDEYEICDRFPAEPADA